VKSMPLTAPLWLQACDEPVRIIVRTLATSPYARLLVFGYIVIMHIWVIIVLQMADAKPEAVEIIAPMDGQLEQGPLLEQLEESGNISAAAT